jgi:hypothetical protein
MNATELKQWEVDAAFALFRRLDRLATAASGRLSRAYRKAADAAHKRYLRIAFRRR